MQGIHAINAACTLPVLRPLAGMDINPLRQRGLFLHFFDTPSFPQRNTVSQNLLYNSITSAFFTASGEFRLYVVPFTELQLYLLDNVAHDKLTIHLKRAMMRAGVPVLYPP